MAYTAANLSLGFDLIGDAFRVWIYKSIDPTATVDNTDYFTLVSQSHGMKEGDLIIQVETDTDPPTPALMYCSEIDADGNGTAASLAVGGSPSVVDLTVSGNANIGDAAADLLGFHGATNVSQRASSLMATTNMVTSASVGTLQVAIINEIQNTINTLGLHKGTA